MKSYNYLSAGTSVITTTGNIAQLDPGGCGLVLMNNATLATIQGIKAGYPGELVTIASIGAGEVDLANQNSSANAADRLINFNSDNSTILEPGVGRATYQYDEVTARWRLKDCNQSVSFPLYIAASTTASSVPGFLAASIDNHGSTTAGAFIRFRDLDQGSPDRGYLGYGTVMGLPNLSDFGFVSTHDLCLQVGGSSIVQRLQASDLSTHFNGGIQFVNNATYPGSGSIMKSGSDGLLMSGITGSTRDLSIYNPAGSNVIIGVPTGTLNLGFGGKIITYNGISTAGFGVPAIVGYGRQTSITSGSGVVTLVTFTVGGSDGSFFVSGNMLFASGTGSSGTIIADYFSENGVEQASQTIITLSAAGFAAGGVIHIRAQAGTVIKIKCSVSGGTGTFNFEGSITQIA